MNDSEDHTPEDREAGTRKPTQRRNRERVAAQEERTPERKNVTATPQQSMYDGEGGYA